MDAFTRSEPHSSTHYFFILELKIHLKKHCSMPEQGR